MGIEDKDESLDEYVKDILFKRLSHVVTEFVKKTEEKDFNHFMDSIVNHINKENYEYLNEMSKIFNIMYTLEHP